MRISEPERTVTCVIVPNDLQEEPAQPTPPNRHGTVHSGIGFQAPRVTAANADPDRAAEALNAGERVGQGALHAGAEVVEAA
jgi:pyruvate dehydrogenase (quinone)